MIKRLGENCAGVGSDFKGYWQRYGGMSCLITSPFFWAAAGVTFICAPYWWNRNWWELSVSVIPAVLGFSIAAFALLLSLGDDSFKLRFGQVREEGKISTLTNVATSFFHFIVVQALALAVAFVGGARILSELLGLLSIDTLAPGLDLALMTAAKGFRAFGFFLLAYSLLTAVAAALTIYKLALIYSTHATAAMSKGTASGGEGDSTSAAPP